MLCPALLLGEAGVSWAEVPSLKHQELQRPCLYKPVPQGLQGELTAQDRHCLPVQLGFLSLLEFKNEKIQKRDGGSI